MQAARAAFKIQFLEKITSGKKLNFSFLRQISQDELEVNLFNTPKLTRGLFLGAGCFWVFLFLFCSFQKNSQTSKATRGFFLVEDCS